MKKRTNSSPRKAGRLKNRKEWLTIKKKKENEAAEEAEKMPLGAKIFDIAFTVFVYLLAAAILIGALLFSFSTSPDKALFGYRYYTVLTGSMSPTYNVGDMIFVQLKDPASINVGDVITFNPSQDSDAYLTHRVTEKIENYEGSGVTCFRTQGDANDSQDSFLIDGERVIGTVNFGIPMIGYVVRFIQLRWYFILPIVIMIAVFFQLLKRYFLMDEDEEDQEEEKKEDEKTDSPPGTTSDEKPSSDTADAAAPPSETTQPADEDKSEKTDTPSAEETKT